MSLSKEKIEQIRNEAKDFYNNAEEGHDQNYYSGLIVGYKAGATAESLKALCLIEALEDIVDACVCNESMEAAGLAEKIATAALQSYTNSLK